MLSTRRILVLLVGCLMASGCGPSAGGNGGDDDGDGGSGGPDARPGPSEFADALPTERCDKMDLVFVVDDSGSMVEEQDNLAANFGNFISVLDNYDAGGLDYRVAVTTTGRDLHYYIDEPPLPPPFNIDPPPIEFNEAGDDGAFRQGCGMSKRWMARADGNVDTTFECVAEVGTGGPSIEMPLYTLELAFTARQSDGTNQGFLRDDALLGVVIISDEDDCSRTDNDFTVESDSCNPEWAGQPTIGHFVSFLDDLKGDRGRWATAVIAGPGPGSCSSTFGEAIEARRLGQFVDQTGTNAVFSSICDGDLASALGDALDKFTEACDNFPPVP